MFPTDTEFENNKDAANLDIQTFGRYGGVGLTIGSDFTYQKGKVSFLPLLLHRSSVATLQLLACFF